MTSAIGCTSSFTSTWPARDVRAAAIDGAPSVRVVLRPPDVRAGRHLPLVHQSPADPLLRGVAAADLSLRPQVSALPARARLRPRRTLSRRAVPRRRADDHPADRLPPRQLRALSRVVREAAHIE